MPILRETLDLNADTQKNRHQENPPRFIPLLSHHSQTLEYISVPLVGFPLEFHGPSGK